MLKIVLKNYKNLYNIQDYNGMKGLVLNKKTKIKIIIKHKFNRIIKVKDLIFIKNMLKN